MAQPPDYNPNTFANKTWDAGLRPLLDTEHAAIKAVLDVVRTNLAAIQRDDTKLKNGSVHLDALTQEVLDIFQAGVNNHDQLTGLGDDDHKQYTRVDGSRAFTAKIRYSSHPSFDGALDIVDKKYVDDEIAAAEIGGGGGGGDGDLWSDPVDASIVPDADSTYNLGDLGARFASVHTDQLEMGGVSASAIAGADETLLTGTPGADGKLSQWNADGDLVGGPGVKDEDDMASDSAVDVPVQQSVKAYADLVRTVSESAAFTVDATHLNRTTRCSHATGLPVTFPADATDNLPVGFKGVIKQVGAGQVTFDDDGGAATIRQPSGFNLKTAQRWSAVYYEKVAADTWEIVGDLEVATRAPNAQTGTSYTLALTDAFTPTTMDNVAANTVTIPDNATVPFPIGATLPVWQLGSGTTEISAAAGVTLNGVSTGSANIGARYHGVVLLKVATNAWIMTGDHDAVA